MEDDKLDFGDLDDFDIPQDGLGDDFSTGIDDLAELERELGLDDLNDDIDTQPLTSSSTTTAAAATTFPDLPKKDLPASSSKQATAPTFSSNERNKSTLQSTSHANESSSSTSRPFVARGKQPYTNNNNRYQQYNNSNQQPNFMNLPYSGMNQFNMMPMVGGPLPFGQGFMKYVY
ncbi:hypothetical protein [Absidia glauca]|uniref:Uncharacterized protein n=1 Tax=Absidia glauca TaxID=4829 RepID=A0A163IWC0_ABSGL|nr:hypothetical protein [Absidia glauca]